MPVFILVDKKAEVELPAESIDTNIISSTSTCTCTYIDIDNISTYNDIEINVYEYS